MSLHDFNQALLWCTVTIAGYLAGLGARRLAHNHALANPTLIAMMVVITTLTLTRTPYPEYFRATWIITFLLAPATVALGMPLARNFTHVRENALGLSVALLAGSVTSMLSGVLLVRWLGGSHLLAMSMLPKAATSPIALAVAQEIGGQAALGAVLAIMGGLTAAITLKAVLRLFRVSDGHAIGLAAGTAGSGIGAARAAEWGDGAAAFAAFGIGLNGLLTALLAPVWAVLFK